MNPGEERLALVAIEPMERRVHHLVAGPLHRRQIEVLELPQVELVVVDAEALVEAPAAVEHERSDERAGLITVRRKHFSERRLPLR